MTHDDQRNNDIEAIMRNTKLTTGFCTIQEHCFTLTYYNNRRRKRLVLDKLETARLLVKNRLIHAYSVPRSGEVKMYREQLDSLLRKKGLRIIWKPKLVEIAWENIKDLVSHTDALRIVAKHEYKLVQDQLQKHTGKLIRFRRNFFRAA